jgi:TPP-dependent pyruvate/acetoin dehydrogenase alpha subunit
MTPQIAEQLLFQMRRIRYVEQEIARRYSEGKMRCPTHLSVGQEGVAAGVGLALKTSDMAVSGHRAHAHYLAKGGNLPAMLAEIYGKLDGCSRGKGGSMHLIDESVGFMGSTAIVGGTIPVGVGLAYGMQYKRTDQVSCIFHGDAAVETGAFFESVNFAVVKNLPVLFLCENNLYSVYSPLSVRQPEGRGIAKMAEGLGMKTDTGNGNDVAEVYTKTLSALAEIRAGHGPQLLEFSTYRWLEHCGSNYDNDIGYRTEAEYLSWKEKDPIVYFEEVLIAKNSISAEQIIQMDAAIAHEVHCAFEYAENSPFPAASLAYTDLYSIESAVSSIQRDSVGV